MLVFVAVLVFAAQPKFAQKIDALVAKQKRLARAAAPELQVTPLDACAGSKVPVTLTGKLAKGTVLAVESDDVAVKDEKLEPGRWSATLELSAGAPPQTVSITAVAPGGAQTSVRVLHVGCKHAWTVTLDSGETVTVHSAWPKSGRTSGPGEGGWSAGEKSTWDVSGRPPSFVLERVLSEAETAARTERMSLAMNSPKARELARRRAAAEREGEKRCASQPSFDLTLKCMAPIQEEMNAIDAENEELARKARGGPKAGCDLLEVDLREGKLTGLGTRCSDERRHKIVSGSVKGED